jgi:small subunit ribosomal protein S20
LPNIKSSEKDMRKAEKNRQQNLTVKSEVKTVLKSAMASAKTADKDTAFREAVATVDKAASKGVIHPNKAARLKSRLAKRVQA